MATGFPLASGRADLTSGSVDLAAVGAGTGNGFLKRAESAADMPAVFDDLSAVLCFVAGAVALSTEQIDDVFEFDDPSSLSVDCAPSLSTAPVGNCLSLALLAVTASPQGFSLLAAVICQRFLRTFSNLDYA